MGITFTRPRYWLIDCQLSAQTGLAQTLPDRRFRHRSVCRGRPEGLSPAGRSHEQEQAASVEGLVSAIARPGVTNSYVAERCHITPAYLNWPDRSPSFTYIPIAAPWDAVRQGCTRKAWYLRRFWTSFDPEGRPGKGVSGLATAGASGSRNVRFGAVNSRGWRSAFGRLLPDWAPVTGRSSRKPQRNGCGTALARSCHSRTAAFKRANHGTTLRYSRRFTLRRNAL
jgi:hypothetical protein